MNVAEARPQTLEDWRGEILHVVGHALQGRVVGVWQTTADSVVPVFVGEGRPLPSTGAKEIRDVMQRWSVPIPTGSQWLACRLGIGRWCIAPVRREIPPPPPAPGGVERRKRERLALELAGHCLGLAERQFGA